MLQIYKIIRDKQVNFIKKMIENEICKPDFGNMMIWNKKGE